ncbi:MAG: efflux RND transporter periplasmic adaptor subunit [Verrucomicrobia bacterium]|nr:efflux RND transporter periplasmic adaptor subunit [Verrucomicrobiota bacterium]
MTHSTKFLPGTPRSRLRFFAHFCFAIITLCTAQRIGAVETPAPTDAPESRVDWNSINRGSLRSIVRPAQDIRLSSRAAGIVQRYMAEEGQTIKSGDQILILDDDQEKAEVAQAEAVLRGAEADMERAEAEFERTKPLSAERIYSPKQFADTKFALETARSRMAQAQAALVLAKVRLANRAITSPINGIFLKKTKEVGESVERFEPVARIVDRSYLEIVVYCDGSLYDTLSKRSEVAVQVSKSDDRHVVVQGQVTYVDPIIDSTGTFRIRVRLPSSEDIAPGLTAVLLPQLKLTSNAAK